MTLKNKQVLLASRPTGWVTEGNFKLVETDVKTPSDGQVVVRVRFLSLDPYMRGRMNDAKSYAEPVAIGAVMIGGAVGEVIESKNPKLAVGDTVVGSFGWQQYALSDGQGVMKVDPRMAPISAYLG